MQIMNAVYDLIPPFRWLIILRSTTWRLVEPKFNSKPIENKSSSLLIEPNIPIGNFLLEVLLLIECTLSIQRKVLPSNPKRLPVHLFGAKTWQAGKQHKLAVQENLKLIGCRQIVVLPEMPG